MHLILKGVLMRVRINISVYVTPETVHIQRTEHPWFLFAYDRTEHGISWTIIKTWYHLQLTGSHRLFGTNFCLKVIKVSTHLFVERTNWMSRKIRLTTKSRNHRQGLNSIQLISSIDVKYMRMLVNPKVNCWLVQILGHSVVKVQ